MNSQTQKILELLNGGEWVCTSQMYALYMADPRRRLCDLRDKGYILEKRRCELHDYHRGGSKMWRLVSAPSTQLPEAQNAPNPVSDSQDHLNKEKGKAGQNFAKNPYPSILRESSQKP